MSLLSQIPFVAEKLGEGISGLGVNYRHSPIVENHADGRDSPAAGDRAPDASLDRASGGTLRLYDLFAEHRHSLLLWENLPEAVSAELPRYPERFLAVHNIGRPGVAGAELLDRGGEVAARYGSTPAAYLIRPDGYVAFRCGAEEVSANLPRYLADLFGKA